MTPTQSDSVVALPLTASLIREIEALRATIVTPVKDTTAWHNIFPQRRKEKHIRPLVFTRNTQGDDWTFQPKFKAKHLKKCAKNKQQVKLVYSHEDVKVSFTATSRFTRAGNYELIVCDLGIESGQRKWRQDPRRPISYMPRGLRLPRAVVEHLEAALWKQRTA